LRITWQRQALDDLIELQAFIGKDDPRAAARTARRIRLAVETLGSTPRIGRPGRVKGTRELVIGGTPFIVPYRLMGAEVQILRVYHAARRWPKRL
jgi:plasmid stabilization system protein ParE